MTSAASTPLASVEILGADTAHDAENVAAHAAQSSDIDGATAPGRAYVVLLRATSATCSGPVTPDEADVTAPESVSVLAFPSELETVGAAQLLDLASAVAASGKCGAVTRGAVNHERGMLPVVFLGIGTTCSAAALRDAGAALARSGVAAADLILRIPACTAATCDAQHAEPTAVSEARRTPALFADTVHGCPGQLAAEASENASPADLVEALVLGYLLGSYRYTAYLSDAGKRAPRLLLDPSGDGTVQDANEALPEAASSASNSLSPRCGAAIARARAIADAVCLARDLVNTPPNHLGPDDLAATAASTAERLGLHITVWDEDALEADGFGGHLAVGRGSARAPRLVRLAYRPAGAQHCIALVGKGITFDTGGLSLKPAAAMVGMKFDMAGAATVLATMAALAELQVPVAVTGWMCIAENMPSGDATRPDDIIRIHGGQTVEVTNTDAEGRLVLADGIAAAGRDETAPDAIIDIATLTGAQLVALGERTTGVMGNSDLLVQAILECARDTNEAMWGMPIPEEILEPLASDVADLANARPGNRNGGMVMAAAFLREFVGERNGAPIPWAHLDIAGPANNERAPHGVTPKGATGVAVRTLVAFVESLAAPRAAS